MEQINTACSKYESVKALLLYWEVRDKILEEVEREVDKLKRLFTNDFCFNVEVWKLPCDGTVKRQLPDKLLDFSEHARERELLIIYYGGHAGNEGGSCTWYAGVGGHSVEWNSLAQILTNNHSDVLFILDCCEATSAVVAFSGGQARHGANWLLASSGIDKKADAVSRTDFTRLMIRTLKDMVNDFYENDIPRITSEDLHTALHLDHWQRLRTNAVHVRLNRNSSGDIDLTPLISRSVRHANEDGFKYQLEYPLPSGSALPADVLDIVLVPGGNGNPVTSFTAKLKDGNCMWPQDVLVPMLEADRISCRLLPFQHHWNGQGYSYYEIQMLERSSKALANAVYKNWKISPHRPLLFLAYGRGCTVVRKALHNLYRNKDFATVMPRIGCVLCGTNPRWEEIDLKSEKSNRASGWKHLSDVVLWIDYQSERSSGTGKNRVPSIPRRSSSSRERRSSADDAKRRNVPHGASYHYTSTSAKRTSSLSRRPRSRTRSRSRGSNNPEGQKRSRERSHGKHRSRSRSRGSNNPEGRKRSRERSHGKHRSRSRERGRSKEPQLRKRAPTPPYLQDPFDDPVRATSTRYQTQFGSIRTSRPRRSSSADWASGFSSFNANQPSEFGGTTGFRYDSSDRYQKWGDSKAFSSYGSGSGQGRQFSENFDSARHTPPEWHYGDFFKRLNRELAGDDSSARLDLILKPVGTLFGDEDSWQSDRSGQRADYSWRFQVML